MDTCSKKTKVGMGLGERGEKDGTSTRWNRPSSGGGGGGGYEQKNIKSDASARFQSASRSNREDTKPFSLQEGANLQMTERNVLNRQKKGSTVTKDKKIIWGRGTTPQE